MHIRSHTHTQTHTHTHLSVFNLQFLRVLFNVLYIFHYTGKAKYMGIGRHRVMITNEHIKIGSNSYEKVKNI